MTNSYVHTSYINFARMLEVYYSSLSTVPSHAEIQSRSADESTRITVSVDTP